MSEVKTRRPPQVFETCDPAVIYEPVAPLLSVAEKTIAPRSIAASDATGATAAAAAAAAVDTPASPRRGVGWLGLLVSALLGLAGLAAAVTFTNFVSIALGRTDWIGMLAWGLVALAVLATVVLAGRELVGLLRLHRIARLRKDADAVLRSGDLKAERAIVGRVRAAVADRPELAWPLARFKEHESDIRDRGELLALADRELLAPLDLQAKRLILGSAKRVSMVTALSPMAFIAVGFVLVENLRLLRQLATLYGGRPGFLGSLRLARMVFVHLVATGGVALTDDLLGQFIGQDLVRRLSRRLGEGVFNGALTARIGTVALDVCRPLPFIEAPPVRIRDVLAEFMRKDSPTQKEPAQKGPAG